MRFPKAGQRESRMEGNRSRGPVHPEQGKGEDTKRRTITQTISFSSPPQTKENQSLSPSLHLHIPDDGGGRSDRVQFTARYTHSTTPTHTRTKPKPRYPTTTTTTNTTPPSKPNVSIHLRAIFSQGRILPDWTYVAERFRWVSPVGSSDQLNAGQGPHAVFVAECYAEYLKLWRNVHLEERPWEAELIPPTLIPSTVPHRSFLRAHCLIPSTP